MEKTGIIITGSTGYLGSKLISKLKPNEVLTVRRNAIKKKSIVFHDTLGNLIEEKDKNFENYIVIHLATYFSKDNTKKQAIYETNINFGQDLLESIENLNIKKIIYTNTMFNFYKEENIRSLEYTKSKNLFGKILEEHTNENNIKLDQIYLDNTFGGLDKRQKIIQVIVESIKEKTGNPVNQKKRFINLVYFQDIIDRILISTKSKISGNSSFINEVSVNISSIYDFLDSRNLNNNSKKNLIYGENDYLLPFPEIQYHGLALSEIDKSLLNYFK